VKIYSSVTSEILPWPIKNIPIKKSASDFSAKKKFTQRVNIHFNDISPGPVLPGFTTRHQNMTPVLNE